MARAGTPPTGLHQLRKYATRLPGVLSMGTRAAGAR